MSAQTQDVLDTPNKNTIFMVWKFSTSDKVDEVFQRICALIVNLDNSAATRFPNAKSNIVMGISRKAWDRLGLTTPPPKELADFEAIVGEKHTAVATDGDLHFHIRSEMYSYCIDMATILSDFLTPVADCIEEVHGFRYWDGRSILGFVDGTENPQGEKRAHFGLIGKEDKAYEGCSYLFVQKYIHDMSAWRALPVTEQEKVIGRSKQQDIEMTDDVKPSNSHSALANVGDDKKIVRDNMPFGNVANNEMGTYFIAYASSFSTVKEMLTRMFVGEPKGNYDRILDFSTAKTGTLYFVPSIDMLNDFAG
ncbi:putative iron-dependent peroxidase [Soonwooa buanensis]|uniref:Putative iron-dependent peroxidase n=1 Tax=Soonwooa buanensis TaxID=619805 RepID=A0A1T5GDM5_9FLAO|nr:Dyp-type peroxidase [Soonwooa buanensis]SKC06387.1 putative iron-dependent peroxidase [Soonwooa buanensis]